MDFGSTAFYVQLELCWDLIVIGDFKPFHWDKFLISKNATR